MKIAGCIVAVVGIAALFFVGASGNKGPVDTKQDMAQTIRSRVPNLPKLRPRWQEVMKEGGIAGMSIVVVQGNDVIYTDALGVRDPENNLPVTPDTMFYIASCTKSFMAMGIMGLVEEGKVDLDAPVKRYLPRFELADPEATKTLTVGDLLCHAKGLNSHMAVFLDAYTGTITEDRYYYWLSKEKPLGKPDYTNIHFTLAGRIAGAVTGESWKDYLEQRIFVPAGMTSTTAYASRMYSAENVAFPSEHDGTRLRRADVRKTDRVMHAAGGLGTTANDLGKWLKLNLNGGMVDGTRILSAEGIEEMQRQHAQGTGGAMVPLQRRIGFGYGWFIGDYQRIRLIDHGGGYIGTAATISFMPDKKLGVAVLSNTGGSFPMRVAMMIYAELLDLTRTNDIKRITRIAPARQKRRREWYAKFEAHPVTDDVLSQNIDKYVGSYYEEHIGTAEVTKVDGRLWTHIGDLPLRMASTGTDTFELGASPGDADAGKFFVDDQGRVTTFVFQQSPTREFRFERK